AGRALGAFVLYHALRNEPGPAQARDPGSAARRAAARRGNHLLRHTRALAAVVLPRPWLGEQPRSQPPPHQARHRRTGARRGVLRLRVVSDGAESVRFAGLAGRPTSFPAAARGAAPT